MPKNTTPSRLDRLQEHLRNENIDLVDAVDCYRELDKIAHRMGLLHDTESFANDISWWPLVAVLGTFSAGKSSFINSYLGMNVQRTGNQAVDDHFTIISYGRDEKIKTLPGQALDSDPRFPFYRISRDIENVAPDEGTRIDKYLQMKVVPSELLRGKLIVDSPGFDADEQRTSTLKITNHIIRLADLVLVFFDARHPETGAMKDTLEHLVREQLDSIDSQKYLYILNQIDTAARENNLEDVVASWRSSLVQYGLTAGKFFLSYNEQFAEPATNKEVWESFKNKRNKDHAEIVDHLDNIGTIRAYRIVSRIKLLANNIEQKAMPRVAKAFRSWRKTVWFADLGALVVAVITAFLLWQKGWLETFEQSIGVIGGLAVLLILWHILMGRMAAAKYVQGLEEQEYGDLALAFDKSTRRFFAAFFRGPKGWSGSARRKLDRIRGHAEVLIERLNVQHADPLGVEAAEAAAAAKAAEEESDAEGVETDQSQSPATTRDAEDQNDKLESERV